MSKRRLTPADVLQGKVRPVARALVELIAEVNPTGRGFDAAESKRRYADKSALQSLLVRWYGDAFVAEPTETEGIVLLRHRHFDECACHAQVASLDDAARAWVYQNTETVDATPLAPSRAPAKKHKGPTANPLEAGRSALAEYDFELAEERFRHALSEPVLAEAAARALLELFVDTLARDADALALPMPASASDDPEVRVLIGLAAVRSRDIERAVTAIAGIEHPRCGEVLVHIGQAALAAGDLERTRTTLARLRKHHPDVGVASLDAALGAALKARAAADEAALEALATTDPDAAESAARRLLDAGVPSAVAKRIVKEQAAKKAAAEETARLAAEARRLAQSAEADQRAVDAVLHAERMRSIGLYLELRPELRARIRTADAALADLGDLALALVDHLPSKRRHEVPTAALAIVEAESRWHREGPAAARSLVDRFELYPELRLHARVRRVLEPALETLRGELAASLVARIADCRALVERGDFDAAALLGARLIEERGVAAGLHSQVASLVQRALTGVDHLRALERARATDATLDRITAGLEAAKALATSNPDRWHASVAEVQRLIAERLDVVFYDVAPSTEALIDDEQGVLARSLRVADSGHVYLVASPEGRAWVTELAPPDFQISRRFSVAIGASRRVRDVVVCDDVLWLSLSDGAAIVLARDEPTKLVRALPALAVMGSYRTAVSPDASTYVVELDQPGHKRILQLAEHTGAPIRVFPAAATFSYFGSAEASFLLVAGTAKHDWAVYTARGVPVIEPGSYTDSYATLVPFAFVSVGNGFIGLAWDLADFDPGAEVIAKSGPIHLVRTDAAFVPLARTCVTDDACGLEAWLHCAGTPSEPRIAVCYDAGDHWRVDTFTLELQTAGRVTFLAGHAWPLAGQRSSLFLARENHCARVALAPPLVDDGLAVDSAALFFPSETLSPKARCATSPDRFAQRLFEGEIETRLTQAMARHRGRERARSFRVAGAAVSTVGLLTRLSESLSPDTKLLVYWVDDNDAQTPRETFVDVADSVLSFLPGDPGVASRLRAAHDRFAGRAKAHVLHLLGLHHLQSGRRDEAIAVWRQAETLAACECGVTFLRALVGREGPGFVERVQRLAQQYDEAVAVMARLDAHLSAGRGVDGWADARRVRALVGSSWQLQARVVTLHLDYPELSVDRWRREVDLAWFGSGAWYRAEWSHMVFEGCDKPWRELADLTNRARAALGWQLTKFDHLPAAPPSE